MTTQSNPISDERNFRPKTLKNFIVQGVLKRLRLMLSSVQQRTAVMEYDVFHVGTGLGKTTPAAIIAASRLPVSTSCQRYPSRKLATWRAF
jgi:Holliday junction resolvasome RuvABC ATP-dependent DNA helicase subunit